LPRLRRLARDPEVELHPDTAHARGIKAHDWVKIETPAGSVRARAKLNPDLDRAVVCGQHGCANLNGIIRHRPSIRSVEAWPTARISVTSRQ
jgi:anaerobic selenocysteine-containing dehydrogenase